MAKEHASVELGREMATLLNNFTYHPPFGDQPQRYIKLRDAAKTVAELFLELCPSSRERSLAMTNLEQAVFWANAAIARNEKP